MAFKKKSKRTKVLRKVLRKKRAASPDKIRKLRELFDIVERGKFMWESTFDAIRDPVLIINKGYKVARANLAAAERSGRTIQQLVGGTCYEIFAGRTAVCPHCPLSETLKLGVPRSVAIDGMMDDGDFIVNSYPLSQNTQKSGPGPLVVHHYRDVTEEKRLQRKLIQSEKMAAIGMLAGGVAHEINNPLAGILAFTQLLKNEILSPQPNGDLAGDLNEIEQAAKRCKKIVEDLLMFARPHGETELKVISLTDTMDQILPLAKLNLKHRNVSLFTRYEPDAPSVRGSQARLQQVFLNLINNAAQSMSASGGEGGEVTVSIASAADGRHAIAEVRDSGCGIRQEDMGKIFDPFYSTKGREGTGLGLSICYSIISEHGGKLEVESEFGVGSAFRVVLPAQTGEAGSSLKSGEILLSPKAPSRKNIHG